MTKDLFRFLFSKKWVVIFVVITLTIYSSLFDVVLYLSIMYPQDYDGRPAQNIHGDIFTSDYFAPRNNDAFKGYLSELYSDNILSIVQSKGKKSSEYSNFFMFGNASEISKGLKNILYKEKNIPVDSNIVLLSRKDEEEEDSSEPITKDGIEYISVRIPRSIIRRILFAVPADILEELNPSSVQIFCPSTKNIEKVVAAEKIDMWDVLSNSSLDYSNSEDHVYNINIKTGGHPVFFTKSVDLTQPNFLLIFFVPFLISTLTVVLIGIHFVVKSSVMDMMQQLGLELVYGAGLKNIGGKIISLLLLILGSVLVAGKISGYWNQWYYIIPPVILVISGIISLTLIILGNNHYVLAEKRR